MVVHCVPVPGRWCDTSVGSALDSHAVSHDLSPGENILFLQLLSTIHTVWTYLKIKGVSISYHIYMVRDVKEPLSLK